MLSHCGVLSLLSAFLTSVFFFVSLPIILQAGVPAHLCTSPIPKPGEGSDDATEAPGPPGSRRKKRRRKRVRSDSYLRDDDDSSSSDLPEQEEESVLVARSE